MQQWKFSYNNFRTIKIALILIVYLVFSLSSQIIAGENQIQLNDLEYFETAGLNVLVFSNKYDGMFFDEKKAGIELIHHGVRTATGGSVRLNTTPEQWDQIPKTAERKVDKEKNLIEVLLRYEEFDFDSRVIVQGKGKNVTISVYLDNPLPEKLEGNAGFNLEFLPASYFEKTYRMDDRTGLLPLYPSGPTETRPTSDKVPQFAGHTTFDDRGRSEFVEPKPIADGKRLILAPEDPERRVTIRSLSSKLMLLDGRNLAQNGWYVVRELIPAGQSGKVLEWMLSANTMENWKRPPMIAYSQAGYHPDQEKIAVIELDKNDTPLKTASLLQITPEGKQYQKLIADVKEWGDYLRYHYVTFDFSPVREAGLYRIQYGDHQTNVFPVADDVYHKAWHQTLDVWFPVQMDHMFVNEAYRVWHGAAHLDDALQAPLNHQHFDGYRMGPSTETQYEPGQRIPGLNIGGWFDAGDFDIRTGSHCNTVLILSEAWEHFSIKRDETLVDRDQRYVDIHHPDSIPDILQQIEHGTLALIAQHRAFGRAIPGIIVPELHQYHHLGDGSTMTDNLNYNPDLKEYESNGFESGTFDDRWAFTNKSAYHNYASMGALSAASRALRGYNDTLADECLTAAQKAWDDEHMESVEEDEGRYRWFRKAAELNAALQLYISTKDTRYYESLDTLLWPVLDQFLGWNIIIAARALPHADDAFKKKLEPYVHKYKRENETLSQNNPFGVLIGTRGWAGSPELMAWAITNYMLHQVYPDIIGPEYTIRGLNYLFGCHPASNISFVSGVGLRSKKIAYGNNRADYSFIAGGVCPGVLILKPDFPENKEDWPFIWGENEYVIDASASYIYLVNAVNDLLNKTE